MNQYGLYFFNNEKILHLSLKICILLPFEFIENDKFSYHNHRLATFTLGAQQVVECENITSAIFL